MLPDIETVVEALSPGELDFLTAIFTISSVQTQMEATQQSDDVFDPETEPTSTLVSYNRNLQKALPGFGNDKLIKLNQGKMF